MKTNEEILNEIHLIKNHSPNTKKIYKRAVKQYCTYHELSMAELISEAEEEEDEKIAWKHRKIKNRLIQYRQYLIENFSKNTVRTNFTPITVIYKYYEIELHPLPQIHSKSIKQSAPITFKDLPDKEIIRAAVDIAAPLMKAIILFMASSGCAKHETLNNITIMDYIIATEEYHNSNDIYEIIDTLNQRDDVIPTFNILRSKTNKYYTTYCTPEAVRAINSYLLTRTDPLTPESPLFKIGEHYFTLKFEQINNELGLGKINGQYIRFRSHMLRKFHASALYNDGLSLDKVNDLQGKAKNKTDTVYFMTNPDDLKYEYIEHMSAVTMGKDVEKVTVKSPEFSRLEDELRKKSDEVEMLSRRQDEIEKLVLGGISDERLREINKLL